MPIVVTTSNGIFGIGGTALRPERRMSSNEPICTPTLRRGRDIMTDISERYGEYAGVMVSPYSFGKCVKSNIILDETAYYNFDESSLELEDADHCLLAILFDNPRGKYWLTNADSITTLCNKITTLGEARWTHFTKLDLQFLTSRLAADQDKRNEFTKLKKTLADIESEDQQLRFDYETDDDDRYQLYSYSNGRKILKRKMARTCDLPAKLHKRSDDAVTYIPGQFLGSKHAETVQSVVRGTMPTVEEPAVKPVYVNLGLPGPSTPCLDEKNPIDLGDASRKEADANADDFSEVSDNSPRPANSDSEDHYSCSDNELRDHGKNDFERDRELDGQSHSGTDSESD